jgi:RNA recognition motif-containing protein
LKIFVGNLSYDTRDAELREAFSRFGDVTEASVVMDRMSDRSRGFGFVEMPNQAEAQAAITGLNGRELQGRPLTVNEARPREDRGPRPQRAGGGRPNWR